MSETDLEYLQRRRAWLERERAEGKKRLEEKLRAYKNAIECILNELEATASKAHDLYRSINDDLEEASK
jgi:hypothetical protein